MSDSIQLLLVILAAVFAALYLIWRSVSAFRTKGPGKGCGNAGGCSCGDK
jgi:hypothetical protein